MRYYLWADGTETGPISREEFHRRADMGQLPAGVLCRAEDGEEWVEPREILEATGARGPAVPITPRQRRSTKRTLGWIIVGACVVAGLLAWAITKTKAWEVVAASGFGVVGAGVGLVLLGMITTWAVLWTVFPVFVYFYLQDIRDDVRRIRQNACLPRSEQ